MSISLNKYKLINHFTHLLIGYLHQQVSLFSCHTFFSLYYLFIYILHYQVKGKYSKLKHTLFKNCILSYYLHGSQNRKIREILNANGLDKCDFKAIIFKQLKEEHPPEEMLENMPDRNTQKMQIFIFTKILRLPVLTSSTLLLLIFLEM